MNVEKYVFCIADAKNAVNAGLPDDAFIVSTGWHRDGVRVVVDCGAIGHGCWSYIVANEGAGRLSVILAPWCVD